MTTRAPSLHPALLVRVAIIALLVFAGWRVVGGFMAQQRMEMDDVDGALAWRPYWPSALLAKAETALRAGDPVEAQRAASRLLGHEPLQGKAFRVLAEVADANRADNAVRLHEIALRRAPRDLRARAWVIQHQLDQGHFSDAVANIDQLLTVAPGQRQGLLPTMAQLAVDPRIADAMAIGLAKRPAWRAEFLAALTQTPGPAAGNVLGRLHAKGGLDDAEMSQWLEWLMGQGRWGQAYGYWASRAALRGDRLPLAYNGDFAHEPTGEGFDWRVMALPGTTTSFVPDPEGGKGFAMQLEFASEPVARAEPELPLLLASGRYLLRYRAKADRLVAERGMQLVIFCRQSGAPVVTGTALVGTFADKSYEEAFTVAAADCDGQWLRVVNTMASQEGRKVGGTLWLDDVSIVPQTP